MDSLLNLIRKANDSSHLLKSASENIIYWLTESTMPSYVNSSLEYLIKKESWEELNDRFYKDIVFGTGGMRGRTIAKNPTPFEIKGNNREIAPINPAIGSNMLNDFTIIKGTIALYKYVLEYLNEKKRDEKPKIVIAHDVRFFSRHFCELVASTWTKLGGDALIFEGPRSTPQLSFSVRHYNCHCGVVITASHNPYYDNGFKVYFEDGAQVTSPHAENIIGKVKQIELKYVAKFLKKEKKVIKVLQSSSDEIYLNELKDFLLNKSHIKKSKLKVVFSPIHGVGHIISIPLLKSIGIHVFEVQDQNKMDSSFSTVDSPNPENASALSMAIDLANNVKADLVIATDPDCDRMGVAVRNNSGEMQLLSGNQIGSLMADYQIQTLKDNNVIPKKGCLNAALVKTFVTTPLQDAIGKYHGLKVINTLTGFKWIGKKLANYEENLRIYYKEKNKKDLDYNSLSFYDRAKLLLEGSTFFVFGGEESYGYLAQDTVRDKDANAATALFSEMTAFYKSRSLSIIDVLEGLYLKHGYFYEKMINIYYEGAVGAKKISNILNSYRNDPPKRIGEFLVESFKDFEKDKIFDADNHEIPKENFLLVSLKKGYGFAVRSSGTEPKIKFYLFGNVAVKNKDHLEKSKLIVEKEINMLEELIKNDANSRALRNF